MPPEHTPERFCVQAAMTEPARLPLTSTAPAFVGTASSVDASVNWVREADIGRVEARYVRRSDDYFVVYLSSQTGCVQACRMCHLTASGQTQLRNVTLDELLANPPETNMLDASVFTSWKTAKNIQRIQIVNGLKKGELTKALAGEGAGTVITKE